MRTETPNTPSGAGGWRALAQEVIALAWPVALAGLATTAVLFTDRLMLGRYGATELGSMQVSGPLIWSVFSVFGAFAAGVTAVVGRAVGAERPGYARRAMIASMGVALVLGALVGAAGFAAAPWIAVAVTGGGPETEALRALAVDYMRVVLPCAPLALVAHAGTAALQASGDTKTPMRAGLAEGAINLAMSYVLIFGAFGAPELGVVGAAIGTVCAIGVYSAWILAALAWGRGAISLGRWSGSLLEPLRPVLQVAGPAFGEKVVFHTGYMLFVALVGRLGEAAMTAHQALMAIESLGYIGTGGFSVAASALVAQKLGAGRPDEAARSGWAAVGLGTAALCGVSLVFLVAAEPLVGLFTDDPEIVATGAACLRVAALAQPLMAITDACAGALRGAGDTRTPMIVALVGPVGVRLAACWWLAFHLELGLLGIWLGTTLDWGCRAVWLAWAWRRGKWRTALEL